MGGPRGNNGRGGGGGRGGGKGYKIQMHQEERSVTVGERTYTQRTVDTTVTSSNMRGLGRALDQVVRAHGGGGQSRAVTESSAHWSGGQAGQPQQVTYHQTSEYQSDAGYRAAGNGGNSANQGGHWQLDRYRY